MKNYNYLFLAMLLFIVGCVDNNKRENLSPSDSLKIAIEDSIKKAKRDSLDKAEAEKQAYLNRPWKLGKYNDEFGEPTDKKYIKTTTSGYFSNSAVTNEYLYVQVIVDKEAAGIFLHEYRRTNAPEKFIGSATIKMRNSAGEELKIISASEWNQSGGILIKNFTMVKGAESYEYSQFRNFLKKSEGEIKVVIYDKYSSTYKFSIDTKGFSEEFNLL